MPVAITDITNLQQLTVEVSGPAPANQLIIVAGTARLPFTSSVAQGGGTLRSETFTALVGPTLTSAQFIQAIAMAAPAHMRQMSAGVLVHIAQADADFDDDSGRTQLTINGEILGDIQIGAAAFQVTILAAI